MSHDVTVAAAQGDVRSTFLGGFPGQLVEEPPWFQEAGATVFEPFPMTTDYFGEGDHAWMVNFRVRDLVAMAAELRGAGIAVEIDPKEYPNSRFARTHDPEGNPIELWEPAGPSASARE